jgi:hypothetical protein
MRYHAYLEIGPSGHCIAYVFSLPGLSLRARRAEEALAAMPAAIRGEIDRLRDAGRIVQGAGEAVEVAEAERETVRSDVEHGVSSVLFRYELRPTRDEDVALVLDRLELDRARMPEDAMRAVADGEWWLLSRLGTRPWAPLPEEPRERFEAVRALTIERFANLLPGDRERHAVFAGEQWTTRKVLRRLACLSRDALTLPV